MRLTLVGGSLALLLAPALVAAENEPQSGNGGECVDDYATYVLPQAVMPLPTSVEVDAGTDYRVASTSTHIFVDFFDEERKWVGWNAGRPTGTVPADADFGVICPAQGPRDPVFGLGYAPDMMARWTYQDGF